MLRISVAKSALAVLVFLSTMVMIPVAVGAAPVTCGGVVFQDYDNDGERAEDYSFAIDTASSSADYGNILDPGVLGIDATVTTASGAIETATTNADGEWSVTVDDADFPIRVEFSGLPSGWQASPAGADNGTLTQFVESAADCAGPFDGAGRDGNAGILPPGSFCENRPEFVTSCFLFGNVADHDDQPAVVAVLDGSKDNNAENNWQNPPYTQRATLGEVGTVWGTGVDRTTGDAYLGAFVKRHTRLAGNPTTIYRVTAGGSVAPWFTVDNAAADPHTAAQDAIDLGLADPLDGWIYDYGSFDDVGKAGLGDVEVSLDGNTLYTIDLGNRELVAVPIQADGSPGTPTRTAITAAALGLACPNSDVRPFGLGIDDDGLVHVGVVCSAESTVPDPFTPITQNGPALGDPSQLGAYVFTYNGSFSLETNVPLPTTSRGSQVSGGTIFAHQAQWRPWVDRMPYTPANIDSYGNTYAQPIVSDIAFDGDDMIIGLMDRWAHQTGANAFYEDWTNPTQPNGGFASEQPVSSGDILRAVANGSGYDFPQNGADYFYNDFYQTSHLETNLGAAAQIPGRPYLVTAAFDPNPTANTWQSGGLEWFDNTTGDHINGYRLYNGRAAGLDVGTFEKAAGVGDLEAFCGLPSIQIGNRVWFDTNGDGIQDAGEPSMDGVVIELLNDSNVVIDTTTTDGDGEWYFDDVAPGADLKVRIAQVNYDGGGVFASGGTHENQGAITIPDAGSDDGDDSDAMIMDGLPSIMVNVNTTDHTFDFGMIDAGALRLGNRVWLDADGNGSQNGSEPGISGVEVQLWSVDGAGAPDAVIATDTTDGNGFYLFEGLYAGDYVVAIADSQQATGAALEGLGSTSGNGSAPDPDNDLELDDNGDPATGFASISDPVTLTDGGEPTDDLNEDGSWVDADSNLTVDFGFVERLRLGNLVFEDLNGDGDADAGEPGIADVTVQLWSVDGAGAPDTMLATDITDGSGFYQFTDLEPGDYIVAISDGEQLAGNELHRLSSTTGNGIAPDVDTDASDNDDNGEPATNFASITAPITLVGSTEPTGEIDEDGAYADADSNLTVDLGFVRSFRLGNLVWFDADNDGVADAGETPIAGVEVQLWTADGAGAPVANIATDTTDVNGRYLFEDLPGGDYIVAIADTEQANGEPLFGVISSLGAGNTAPDPDNGVDNDDNGSVVAGFAAISAAVSLDTAAPTGETDGLAGGADEDGTYVDATSDLSVDFGFVGSLRLGNRVWLDADGNGSQNGSEPGISGVEVQLWSVDGAGAPDAVIATDTTDGSGFYGFEYLAPGDYIVAIADSEQAAGQPLQGLGSTAGNGTAPDPDDNIDLDDNGDAAPGFAAIAAPVTLTVNGEPLGEADEAGWVDADSNLTVDFGFLAGLRLGNLVFEDLNGDGDADAGEPGIADVTVQLWSVDGAGAPDVAIATTTTDPNGFYEFAGLLPGDYIVAVDNDQQAAGNALQNLASTTGNGIAPDVDVVASDNDDNGDPAGGFATISAPVTLTSGGEPTGEVDEDGTFGDTDSNLTVDLGFVRSFRLGNLVWFDADNDGVADAGETPIPGVQVQLWTADGAGAPVANIATDTTDADGHYLFEGLAAGDYIVAIADAQQAAGQPLSGMTSSLGVADIAPDPDSGVDNDDNGSVVAGFAAISAAVTLDTSAPTGETDGLVGGADEDGTYVDATSDLSVDFGFVGSLRLGNRVWLDADGNGAQNGSEPGISGVEVQLWTADGAGQPVTMVATDTTDASGFYGFEYLAPGDYIVAIADTQQAAGQPLQGLGSTAGNGTAPDPDNDVDLDDNGDAIPGFASITRPVTLSAGTEPQGEVDEAGWVDADSNLTVDLGFTPGVEIGNLVWLDVNNNGIVDGGESGVEGVTVNLLTAGGSVVASTTTDADGEYAFTGIAPGDYIVEIPATQFASGNPLAGWFPSNGAGVSADPDDDLDNNSDGAPLESNAGAVRSGVITVEAGTEPTNEVDESPTATADDESNLTVDFGFYQLSLGDLVWFDDNNNGIQDTGERPVAGVTLRLVDATTGAAVIGPDGQAMVVTTDANGFYSFDGLDEGTYVVEIAASEFAPGRPLQGRASSSGNDLNGAAPDPDNDVDRDDNGDFFIGGLTRSKPVTISAGDEPGIVRNPTVDFGFTPAAGLGSTVFFDNNKNGIRDSGETGVAGVTITVYDADTGAIVGLTVTNSLGEWSVTGLPPGDYFAIFSDPLGRTYTVQNAGTNDSIDSDVSVAGRTQVINLDIGEYDPTLWAGIIPDTGTTTTTTTNRLAFTGTSSGGIATVALLLMAVGVSFLLLSRRTTADRR